MSNCSSRRVRWCPTTEQITVLKELYRRGLTNPNASQIRTITLQLSSYGDVHGKNAFYWFQNRKARDRQMIRRKLHQQHPLQLQLHLFQHANSFINESSQKNIPQDTKERCRATNLCTDCLIRMDDQDLMMIKEVGPIKKKPPETLQLFPLTSSAVNDA